MAEKILSYTTEYIPKVTFSLEVDQFTRLQNNVPFGFRQHLLEKIIEDLNDTIEKAGPHGQTIIGLIINKTIHPISDSIKAYKAPTNLIA